VLAALSISIAVSLCACVKAGAPADWRADAIAHAEDQVRGLVSDPSAPFSRVQVTGDDKTGQTCGYVSAKGGPDGSVYTVRFIVYIDHSAGPFVDPALIPGPLSSRAFEGAWRSDCLKEGYQA
jgi:hypothetical protein